MRALGEVDVEGVDVAGGQNAAGADRLRRALVRRQRLARARVVVLAGVGGAVGLAAIVGAGRRRIAAVAVGRRAGWRAQPVVARPRRRARRRARAPAGAAVVDVAGGGVGGAAAALVGAARAPAARARRVAEPARALRGAGRGAVRVGARLAAAAAVVGPGGVDFAAVVGHLVAVGVGGVAGRLADPARARRDAGAPVITCNKKRNNVALPKT